MFNSFRFLGRRDLKQLAKDLQSLLVARAQGPLDLDACREIVAKLHGHRSWASARQNDLSLKKTVANLALLGHAYQKGCRPGAGKPVFLTPAEQWQQRLVLGVTGSGRTEVMLSMLKPAIDAGQGVVYVDGKGDNSLYMKIYAMAMEAGRLDDLRVLNLMQPFSPINASEREEDSSRPAWDWHGHTFNPLEEATLESLQKWLYPLLLNSTAHSTWDAGRLQDARKFLDAFLPTLLVGRDLRLWPLDFQRMSAALCWENMDTVFKDNRLPSDIRDHLRLTMNSLWGTDQEKLFSPIAAGLRQRLEAFDGYDTWKAKVENGHWESSQIQWEDAILGKKIVIILAPSLEKSPEDLVPLVQLPVNSLIETLLALERSDRLPPNHRAMWVFDATEFYLNESLVILARESRKTGVVGIWGSHDYRQLKTRGEANAESLVESLLSYTNIKIFLKLHNEELPELLKEQNVLMPTPEPEPNAIRDQLAGQAHVIRGSSLDRVDMAYYVPSMPGTMRHIEVSPRWIRELRTRAPSL